MAATMAASNSHRSSFGPSRSPAVPLKCSSSRVRVNPACVPSPAEVKKEAADRQAAWQQRYRSRDEETPRRPSPPIRRRRRDDGDARDASPERKRRRESASYHRDARRGSSSGRPYRRDDRDDAYRAAKKQESDRDRDRNRAREDATRKSVSGAASRPEQIRARTGRPFFAAQQHQFPAAVDDRKPTPEKVETDVVKRRMLDIQRQREEARRAMEEMVKTVEFNDPYISPMDVIKPL